MDLVAGYDLVLNGCDNFPTRYLINDACALLGKPLIDGSIYQFEGQVTVYHPISGSPCYRCRFPEPPPPGLVPSCADAGVLGVLPGIVGTLQAAEVLKWILREAGDEAIEPLLGRLLVIDVLAAEFMEFRYARREDCPLCGDAPTITELIDYDEFCRGDLPPYDDRTVSDRPLEISVRDLAQRLEVEPDLLLLDVREPWEWELCRIDGARLAPLSEFPGQLANLPRDRPIVTYCHAGVRSLNALQQLQQAGFADVQSMAGGIDAWSREIDDRVPRY
jgi:adenylyltransferase/sulfurtransferase